LKDGSKSDRIDARKLAELLRGNQLSPVYHGEHGVRTLKELARTYRTVSQDLVRVMVRVKALYRSWAIPCAGKQVYAVPQRALWLEKIGEAGVRRRAEFYYQQLDALRSLRQEVRRELLAESAAHKASKQLRQIPSIGPNRAALLIALLQTPHRFRSKRQLWAYSGFGIETHDSGEHRYVDGELRRAKKKQPCADSIETTTPISRTCSKARPLKRQCNQDHCASFTVLCWPKESGPRWRDSPWPERWPRSL
jgi:transposase